MFAGKLAARAGAAIDRLGRSGEVGGGAVILRAAPLAVTEQQRAIGRTEQPDELFLQYHAARIFDRAGIGRLGIRKGFIDLHGRLLKCSRSPQERFRCGTIGREWKTSSIVPGDEHRLPDKVGLESDVDSDSVRSEE